MKSNIDNLITLATFLIGSLFVIKNENQKNNISLTKNKYYQIDTVKIDSILLDSRKNQILLKDIINQNIKNENDKN